MAWITHLVAVYFMNMITSSNGNIFRVTDPLCFHLMTSSCSWNILRRNNIFYVPHQREMEDDREMAFSVPSSVTPLRFLQLEVSGSYWPPNIIYDYIHPVTMLSNRSDEQWHQASAWLLTFRWIVADSVGIGEGFLGIFVVVSLSVDMNTSHWRCVTA